MNFYDYRKDYKLAEKCEREIAGKLKSRFNCDRYILNNDNRYDIKLIKGDIELTVEVKQDFTCKRTGNIGLEYECRGKPSGIRTSQSDFYCYRVHESKGVVDLLIKTETLKQLVTDKKFHRTVVGGDEGSSSKNFLFYSDVIKLHSIIIQ